MMKSYITVQMVQARPVWKLTGRDGHEHIVPDRPSLLEGEAIEEGYEVCNGERSAAQFVPKEIFETQYHPAERISIVKW